MFIISFCKNGKDYYLADNNNEAIFSNLKINLKTFENIEKAKKHIVQMRNLNEFKNNNFYISSFDADDLKKNKRVVLQYIDDAISYSFKSLFPKELEHKITRDANNIIITSKCLKDWEYKYDLEMEFVSIQSHVKLSIIHWQKLSKNELEKHKKNFRDLTRVYLDRMVIR